MSEVRVHVRLGTLRLDYQGEQAFYEAHIETLVAAAAARGVRSGGAVPGSGRSAHAVAFPTASSNGPGPTEALGMATEPTAAKSNGSPSFPPTSEAGTPPPRTEYEPSSPEFGRYLRRLGAEADAPDRHVLAFAFYLWNYERLETFGLAEIAGCLKAIGRDLPADAGVLMDDLTEKRRLLESAGAGRWRLAKKGENYVKTRLLTV